MPPPPSAKAICPALTRCASRPLADVTEMTVVSMTVSTSMTPSTMTSAMPLSADERFEAPSVRRRPSPDGAEPPDPHGLTVVNEPTGLYPPEG